MPTMGVPEYTKTANKYNGITMASKNSNINKKAPMINQEMLDRINPKKIDRTAAPRKRQGELDKNDFLRMLSFQMQNQDPMKPMDQTKLTSDLAQFSQLEQLTNINTKLNKDDNKNQLEEKFFAASFLGKSVLTTGRKLKHDESTDGSKIYYSLTQPAESLRIRIFDSKNNLVAQKDLKNINPGPNEFMWKGDTLDGQKSLSGDYTFEIHAWDDKFKDIVVDTQSKGTVTGVQFDQGQVVLNVDGKKVHLYDVKSFEMAQGTK